MKKWKCNVCGYIHEGPEPPDICPVCGVSKDEFVEITEDEGTETADSAPPVASPDAAAGTAVSSAATVAVPAPVPSSTGESSPTVPKWSAPPVPPVEPVKDDTKAGLYALCYGMFVVSSVNEGKYNAQAANTVFQITSEPARLALGINKQNLTHEFISASGVLVVTILGKGNMKDIKRFGFKSGRQADKFQGLDIRLSPKVQCPIIPDGVAYLECRVRPEMSVDVGTHTLFVADVVGGGPLRSQEPITYAYYRANRAMPDQYVDDVDWNNVVAALNLEYGANRRYQYQIAQLNNPDLVSMLEGVMRTEGDHVDNLFAYLQRRMAASGLPDQAKGLSTALLQMRLNLEFEEVARDTYSQFAKETQDQYLKDLFLDQARSEIGHINIFKESVKSLEQGESPVKFFCPLCGWEIDYGTKPDTSTSRTCPKCGAKFSLELPDVDWELKRDK